ncbi:MAG: dienelactone hydrolase [Verrucomicrobiales bacterium]|nr:dienelactone hydrolase [Verrucomicrobiales bacterium]
MPKVIFASSDLESGYELKIYHQIRFSFFGMLSLHAATNLMSMKIPEFTVPSNLSAWHSQRQQIRGELWKLLGDLPPRPKVPEVRTLRREDRGDYYLEKFEFDNGADTSVPGYLLLPKNRSEKAPAILYCHWHGGDYDIGKEELFRNDKTFRQTGLTLVQRGFAVIAIDAHCFGESNGKGPQGAIEKGGAGEMTASKFELWMGRCLWGMTASTISSPVC